VHTPLELALAYIARGWNPVPVPHRGKKPLDDNWQARLVDAASAPRLFNGGPQNVGVMLGPTSQGLTDIDLDCAEAIAIAPFILPRTKAIFGRVSKRMSHWLYLTDLSVTTDTAALQLRDPKSKSMLVELRIGGGGKGAQTVFPGSVHEGGEPISWEEDGEPASVDGGNLRQRVRAIAAYSLLARYWPGQGSRHDAARIIGGFLSRLGRKPEQIKVIAEAIARAAGDEEWRDRRTAAHDAAIAHRDGKHAYGLNALREMVGSDTAAKVAEWLDYREGDGPPPHVEEPSAADDKQPQWQWLNISTWDSEPVPERKWAILDRSPLNQAGLFSGHGGTGKSIVELMKNVAHVAGKDWLGSMPEIGPAIYIGAEDEKDEIHRRVAAIANHYQVTFKQLTDGGLYVRCLLGEDATLCAPTRSGKIETTALYRQLYQLAGHIKPKNISIDTLTRAFAGNELDRVQVYAFAMHMQALAMVGGCSVTVLSHPSIAGMATGSGISGSTAWHNAFRFRHYLKGVKAEDGEQSDNDLRELEFLKNQYGSLGEKIVLRWQAGMFLPLQGVGSLDRAAQQAKADEIFLTLLRRFSTANRNVSDKTSANYAPAIFAQEEEAKRAGFSSPT
jgi:RecA-family ATPase